MFSHLSFQNDLFQTSILFQEEAREVLHIFDSICVFKKVLTLFASWEQAEKQFPASTSFRDKQASLYKPGSQAIHIYNYL